MEGNKKLEECKNFDLFQYFFILHVLIMNDF